MRFRTALASISIIRPWKGMQMFLVKRISLVFILVAVLVMTGFSAIPTEAFAQSTASPEDMQIVDAVKGIFAAAKADDLTGFHAVAAPGFYLYDNGARFDGDAIMKLIKSAHDAGQRYDWNVTEPDVHIAGNTAWIAYVNKGSMTSGSTTQQLSWLESAVLEKEGGSWKIVFMHSTLVPLAKPQ
jgi:SnoaL-like domain